MRPKVLEIAWHETQAVYSCDFQPLPLPQLKRLLAASTTSESEEDKDRIEKGSSSAATAAGGRQYRLATAGGDSKVRIWMVYPNIPSIPPSTYAALTGHEYTPHPPRVEYLATLSKHTAPVNVVRFSPSGQILASAGDDGNVILWVPSDRPTAVFGETSDDLPDKEHWRLQKMLQVTTKHVYDLSWSPDGEYLIAGSTDNTATIWKAATGECVFALREHMHNVQGVSWDPLNEYIATQSSDRAVHVNTFTTRNGIPDVHPVSRSTRMEIRHSRTPSISSASRPSMVRRGSTTSEAGSVITTASDFPEAVLPPHAPALAGVSASATPATPSASVPSTPQAAPAPMNPPATSNRPCSRRSSFSGSQTAASPALSAAAFSHLARSARSPSPIPPLPAIRAPPALTINQRLYGEEGATRFFRRLTFSPDGSLLLTPAGQIEDQVFKGSPLLTAKNVSQDTSDPSSSSVPRPKNVETGKPTAYIYSRANLSRSPIAHLPGHKTSSVAIRFSPVFYDLRHNGQLSAEPKHVNFDKNDIQPVHVSLHMPPPPPSGSREKEKEKEGDKVLGSVFALPYRLLYAVACQDSVLLYDTQQAGPIAIFKGLHYAGFTDVAWSPDGQCLFLSSADGYCSIVIFDLGELGTVHPTQQHHRQLQAIAQSHNNGISTPLPPSLTHRDSIHSSHSQSGASATGHSPAVSHVARQSPAPGVARSDREGSTASSVVGASGSVSASLLSVPNAGGGAKAPPSSASSVTVTDQVLPTPTPSDTEGLSAAGVDLGIAMSQEGDAKKREGAGETTQAEAPKKKRRVALTHLGSEQ
ncbi:chromatin assembly factor 1 subunit B [Cryptococcus neoformans]|nr:chromatin assembly factor 1 subunit B [Cryptococcus neoformans var. grubii]